MTKFFKSKSKPKEVPTAVPVPRLMEELTKANAELNARAAQVQYLAYVYAKELTAINKQLEEINYEAAARKNLDAANAPKEEPQTSGAV